MAVAYYDKLKGVTSVGVSRGGWSKTKGTGDDAGKTVYECTTQGATATVNHDNGTHQDHPPAGAGALKVGSRIKVTDATGRVEVEEDTV